MSSRLNLVRAAPADFEGPGSAFNYTCQSRIRAYRIRGQAGRGKGRMAWNQPATTSHFLNFDLLCHSFAEASNAIMPMQQALVRHQMVV